MRYAARLVFIFAISLVIGHFAAAQAPTPDPQQQPRSVPEKSYKFPCYAMAEHTPKTFNGFWTPEPNTNDNELVTVTIGFLTPDSDFPVDCVGEPLEITVPNDQIVKLVATNWSVGKCVPTLTITPAVADSPVAELLAIAAKGGILGVDTSSKVYGLPKLKNKVLAVTVVCTLTDSRKLTQSVKITYQNPPRIAVSAGLVVSTLGVRSFSIKTTQTGVGSNGVVTTQNSIAQHGPSLAEVVPFSSVNLYWSGSRKLNLSSQVGLGVDPNLSTPRVEFFVAPIAVAWHDFYFSPGIHFGQHEILTGGFSVGEVVTGLTKAPIAFRYHAGLGFSLSYNLKPLVKPSASSK
jgi:hypothetical protein